VILVIWKPPYVGWCRHARADQKIDSMGVIKNNHRQSYHWVLYHNNQQFRRSQETTPNCLVPTHYLPLTLRNWTQLISIKIAIHHRSQHFLKMRFNLVMRTTNQLSKRRRLFCNLIRFTHNSNSNSRNYKKFSNPISNIHRKWHHFTHLFRCIPIRILHYKHRSNPFNNQPVIAIVIPFRCICKVHRNHLQILPFKFYQWIPHSK